MAMSRMELRLSEYSLSELYCLRRFAFLSAMEFSGLALKAAGGRLCRNEMRVLLLSSSSDSTFGSCIIVDLLSFGTKRVVDI